MRHRVSGKHLGRTPSHRVALRRNLAASLFQHGTIRTTEAKAKDVRRFVEKLITIARRGDLHARRLVISRLQDRRIVTAEGEELDQTIVQKLFDEIAPRYADRSGGYTRIIRVGDRRIGDAGQQVLLQLVEAEPAEASAQRRGGSRRRARAAKRIQAAAAAQRAPKGDHAPSEDADVDEPAAEQPEPDDQAPADEAENASADVEAPADEDTAVGEEDASAEADAEADTEEAAAPDEEPGAEASTADEPQADEKPEPEDKPEK